MLLIDAFLLYRYSDNIKRRVAPDLLLMEYCSLTQTPSAYDLDIRTSPRCLIDITSPKKHFKDLQDNVAFYFDLGIETYLVIDIIMPQQPIELHLWRKTQGKSYQKIEADNEGYFLNIKVGAIQQRLIFVDAVTGKVLRDTGAFDGLDKALVPLVS